MGEMLAVKVWGPEFRSLHRHEKLAMAAYSIPNYNEPSYQTSEDACSFKTRVTNVTNGPSQGLLHRE